jgi:hypothetical protein
LKNRPDDPAFRGSMVGEADGAPVLPAIGSVIHSPLWTAQHQGLTSC